MPTEITQDHNDTPDERAAKVWSTMGFTQVWDKPVAKKALAEAGGEAEQLGLDRWPPTPIEGR